MTRFPDFGLTAAQQREAVFGHRYERAGMHGQRGEIWCYTDAIAYPPGANVRLYVCSSVEAYRLQIVRDGASARPILRATPRRSST